MLSKKMLETNHFSDGQFLSMISSFDPKKSYRVTQSTFGTPKNLKTSSKDFNPRLVALGESGGFSGMKRKASQDEGVTINAVLSQNGFLKKVSSDAKFL